MINLIITIKLFVFILFIFNCLSRPSLEFYFMSKFNLRPLSIAILGMSSTAIFANTETDSSSKHQLATIVVSAAGYEQKIKEIKEYYE